jgi:hypothetical protein
MVWHGRDEDGDGVRRGRWQQRHAGVGRGVAEWGRRPHRAARSSAGWERMRRYRSREGHGEESRAGKKSSAVFFFLRSRLTSNAGQDGVREAECGPVRPDVL